MASNTAMARHHKTPRRRLSMLIRRVVNTTSTKDRGDGITRLRFESELSSVLVSFNGCVVTAWQGSRELPREVRQWIKDRGGIA